MKKLLILFAILAIDEVIKAQDIMQGSLQRNIKSNKIDIVFKPTFANKQGEYINYLQFSLAIPAADADGITATAVGVNNFSNMGTLPQADQYIRGSEKIFTWVFAKPSVTVQSWGTTSFIGVEINFNKSLAGKKIKMLDLTNLSGGDNLNTYFAIVSNNGDLTDHSDLFNSIGKENMEGNYNSGDQYIQLAEQLSHSIDPPAKFYVARISPNPATTSMNLLVGSPVRDKVSLQVTDISGHPVINQSLSVEAGNNTLPLNIAALAGGTYMLKMISSSGEVTTGKFVKQ